VSIIINYPKHLENHIRKILTNVILNNNFVVRNHKSVWFIREVAVVHWFERKRR
jgi:hypothetical protein